MQKFIHSAMINSNLSKSFRAVAAAYLNSLGAERKQGCSLALEVKSRLPPASLILYKLKQFLRTIRQVLANAYLV